MATARSRETGGNETAKPVDKEARADLKAVEKVTEQIGESYDRGYHGSDAADRGDPGRPEDYQGFAEHASK